MIKEKLVDRQTDWKKSKLKKLYGKRDACSIRMITDMVTIYQEVKQILHDNLNKTKCCT